MSKHQKATSYYNTLTVDHSVMWGVRWMFAKRNSFGYDLASGYGTNPTLLDWEPGLDNYNHQTGINNYGNAVMVLKETGQNINAANGTLLTSPNPSYLWPVKVINLNQQ